MAKMAQTLPADTDERLLIGLEYWRARHHADGRIPGRGDIDPIDMRRILAGVCLYDVQADLLRFRYRLVGTEVVERLERDYTGHWLDEVHSSFLSSAAFSDFAGVASRDVPFAYYRGTPLFHSNRKFVTLERLLLPLSRDGITVDMLWSINAFHRASRFG